MAGSTAAPTTYWLPSFTKRMSSGYSTLTRVAGSSPWRIWATAKRAVVPAVPMTVPTKTTDSGSRSLHSGGFVVVVDEDRGGRAAAGW